MFTSHPILLTVVIPFRNFDRSAKAMLEAAIEVVAPLVDDYELIVVDNGSSNEEFRDYQPLLGGDGFANIQIYRLLQQVDNDVASIVGIENSLGDYVLVYDPRSENLSQLGAALDKIAEGCEVVFRTGVSLGLPADHPDRSGPRRSARPADEQAGDQLPARSAQPGRSIPYFPDARRVRPDDAGLQRPARRQGAANNA